VRRAEAALAVIIVVIFTGLGVAGAFVMKAATRQDDPCIGCGLMPALGLVVGVVVAAMVVLQRRRNASLRE
jgi:hypothetical protein